jgi:hypothetical protein
MKLIALKDFANNSQFEISSPLHDRLVHKGATFEIGTGKVLKDLTKADQFLVAQLTVSGCVGDATDSKVVKAVQDDVAADKKREETAAKLNTAASSNALIEQLTVLLQKAAAGAK